MLTRSDGPNRNPEEVDDQPRNPHTKLCISLCFSDGALTDAWIDRPQGSLNHALAATETNDLKKGQAWKEGETA